MGRDTKEAITTMETVAATKMRKSRAIRMRRLKKKRRMTMKMPLFSKALLNQPQGFTSRLQGLQAQPPPLRKN